MEHIIHTKNFGSLVMFYDEEDSDIVTSMKWHVQKSPNTFYAIGYSCVKGVRKSHLFHRMLLNPERKNVVDHIDGNGLNNTRSNLRVCSHSENLRNIKKPHDHKGVCWYARDSKWKAQICHNSKRISLGYFSTKLEAAIAYNNKAKELFGDFANLNLIGE